MNKISFLSLAAVLALSAACEARIGKDEEKGGSGSGGTASAAGKAQENTFSIKASGVDIKIAIPEGIRNNASFDSDSDILPPDAQFNGMHVEGEKTEGGSEAGVEIRFTSATAPQALAAWYRDPARKDLEVSSAKQEGQDLVVAGKQKDGDDFTVRLSPTAGGGTDGRVTIGTSG